MMPGRGAFFRGAWRATIAPVKAFGRTGSRCLVQLQVTEPTCDSLEPEELYASLVFPCFWFCLPCPCLLPPQSPKKTTANVTARQRQSAACCLACRQPKTWPRGVSEGIPGRGRIPDPPSVGTEDTFTLPGFQPGRAEYANVNDRVQVDAAMAPAACRKWSRSRSHLVQTTTAVQNLIDSDRGGDADHNPNSPSSRARRVSSAWPTNVAGPDQNLSIRSRREPQRGHLCRRGHERGCRQQHHALSTRRRFDRAVQDHHSTTRTMAALGGGILNAHKRHQPVGQPTSSSHDALNALVLRKQHRSLDSDNATDLD